MDTTEMSLDEIIKFNRKKVNRKNSSPRSKSKGQNTNRRRNIEHVKKSVISRDHMKINRNKGASKTTTKLIKADNVISKVFISNLDFDVSEDDIHELFVDFGALKKTSLHYDKFGRSLGKAEVIYQRQSDAAKAIQQLNGVPLDGRPMNIEFATPELSSSIQKRLKIVEKPKMNINRKPIKKIITNSQEPFIRANKQRFVKGNNRSNFKVKSKKVPVTAERLDADLDSYINERK